MSTAVFSNHEELFNYMREGDDEQLFQFALVHNKNIKNRENVTKLFDKLFSSSFQNLSEIQDVLKTEDVFITSVFDFSYVSFDREEDTLHLSRRNFEIPIHSTDYICFVIIEGKILPFNMFPLTVEETDELVNEKVDIVVAQRELLRD